MKQRFPTKKDWWVSLIFWAAAIVPLILVLIDWRHGGPLSLILVLFVCALLLSIWFGSYAEIDGTKLTLRASLFTWHVDIMHIHAIKMHVHSFVSNTGYNGGLSFDRVAIEYNTYDEVFFSPKDKQGFAKALQAINPQIQIE